MVPLWCLRVNVEYRINASRETGLFSVVALIIFLLALRLDAQMIHAQCPTNVVRGFEYCLEVEIRQSDMMIDTNWYGTINVIADGEILFDETRIDVVKGKGLFPVSIKAVSGKEAIRLTVFDASGRVATAFNDLIVFDPERKSRSLIFNEIMYDTDNDKTDEWFELYNSSDQKIDLEYKTLVVHDCPTISRSYCYTIKPGCRTVPTGQLQLQSGAYAVIVRNLDRFKQLYPEVCDKIISLDPVYQYTLIIEAPEKSDSFNMPNSEGTVFFTDGTNGGSPIIALFYYEDSWGGEKNISLERKSSSIPSAEKMNWSSSIKTGGTPGAPNTVTLELATPLQNELRLSSRIWNREGVPLTIQFKSDIQLKKASLILVSSAGRKMVTFLDDAIIEKDKEYIFELSNKYTAGQSLPVGLYFIRFDAQREDGSKIVSHRILVIGAK